MSLTDLQAGLAIGFTVGWIVGLTFMAVLIHVRKKG